MNLEQAPPRTTTDVASPEEIGLARDSLSDRRADVESKQSRVAGLLRQSGRDGLVLVEPENVAWITSGATPRGHLDQASLPVVYCTQEARWIVASNVDNQRLFDEEIDELGFQLKEWPWHWGREQLLADLCAGRKIACDRLVPGLAADALVLDGPLCRARQSLSAYEQACLLTLGEGLASALEATCRSIQVGDSEREIAGQAAHRMMRRGIFPVRVGAAVDGRSRFYRRFGFTSAVMERMAVVSATGRKYGLHVSASRTVCLGEPLPELLAEHSAAVKVCAAYLLSTWRDAVPSELLLAGRRIYSLNDYEHEWLLAPQGFVTGRAGIEYLFTPRTTEVLLPGAAVTWSPSVGSALCMDTYLVSENGPLPATPTENWPLKRIRAQGVEFILQDVLVR